MILMILCWPAAQLLLISSSRFFKILIFLRCCVLSWFVVKHLYFYGGNNLALSWSKKRLNLQKCKRFLIKEPFSTFLILESGIFLDSCATNLFRSLSKVPFWSWSKRTFWYLSKEPIWSLSKGPFLIFE